jgi:diadenosine tetraphosphate (Ap4A) HIT family hydrolase
LRRAIARQLLKPSPFLKNTDRWLIEGEHCFIYDNDYPVIKSHVLVVPKRELESFEELSAEEWQEIKALSNKYIKESGAIGFNLSHNVGTIAGQSVAHIHFHIFPHFKGSKGVSKGGYARIFGELPDFYKEERG